jgi:hypothetical protein
MEARPSLADALSLRLLCEREAIRSRVGLQAVARAARGEHALGHEELERKVESRVATMARICVRSGSLDRSLDLEIWLNDAV